MIAAPGGQLLQMNAAGLTMIEADDLGQVDGAPCRSLPLNTGNIGGLSISGSAAATG